MCPLPCPPGPPPSQLKVLVTLVKRIALPTRASLPLAAAMMALIRLAYLSAPPALVAGCVVSGLLEALTPLSIIAGAILLFQVMDHTGCLEWIMRCSPGGVRGAGPA
jgi:lactate permease